MYQRSRIIIIIILLAVLAFLVFSLLRRSQGNEEEVVTEPALNPVEVVRLSDLAVTEVETFCSVEAVDDAPIVSERSGEVIQVYVEENQEVREGDRLFALENINERVSVQNARVAVQSAEFALADLLNENNADDRNSLLAQTEAQQDILIEDARNELFNNDLRAYPVDDPEEIDALGPTISGNYNCRQEGEYRIDVYSSNADSGASFRYSGLESGTASVSTTGYGTILGSCGLELFFPVGFDRHEDWVIPIPNTRSATYFSAKSDYENALSSRDIAINNTEASPEQIAQQQAAVNQAQLQLEAANDSLSKTIVRAPVSGTLSDFEIESGDYASAGSELGRVKSIGQLELVAYVNPDEVRYLQPGNRVQIDGEETIVSRVSPTVDTTTRKNKITIAASDELDLLEGTELSCVIDRDLGQLTEAQLYDDGGIAIPLSALSVIGVDHYVFTLEGDIAKKYQVVPGALLGDQIIVYGLENQTIIQDARGIRDGQRVRLANSVVSSQESDILTDDVSFIPLQEAMQDSSNNANTELIESEILDSEPVETEAS